MVELTGWLLDLYADPQDGLVLWLLEDVESGAGPAPSPRRYRLKQSFPVTFYAAGPLARLRALWTYLRSREARLRLARAARRDLFQAEPVTVLAVEVPDPARQPALFARVAQAFPDLTYYDADLALSLRHAAVYGTFPLAHLKVTADEGGTIQALTPLDAPWDIDPQPPPLGVMTVEPDCDPRHAPPKSLHIRFQRWEYRLSLEPERPLLINLAAILRRHDPDLLLTAWGDTWLLPHLLERSLAWNIPLPLNRQASQEVIRKDERTYFTYGQIIHRGAQVQLLGRWHIDMFNAMMFHDYGMEGIFESARVTSLPVQDAARLSPGTGISAMQIITALRQGVLVPWHKQQAESPKTALDFLQSDQGGLVYQPLVGLHRDVAEVDFISMYPSIMAYFNVSPETVGAPGPQSERVPELNLWIDQGTPGLVPQTLKPLLEKRITLKERAATLPRWDPRRLAYKARASAHKWLLVTCFGYLGYKNARFGRIEAHQAVTAFSRECLLRAKEAAEEAGCTVLHMYVDGLWVQLEAGLREATQAGTGGSGGSAGPGRACPQDFQPLLEAIAERTHLPIALDGIYRWVAFLPSRVNARVPVANRYFGVFQDGTLKVRGIEARRRDTPPFIAQAQMGILEVLARQADADRLTGCLPEVLVWLRGQVRRLRARRVPLVDLLVTQKLSRELQEYRAPSPAAQAAAQLQSVGKTVRPGEYVRFLYVLSPPGGLNARRAMKGAQAVHAWDLPKPPPPSAVDTARYLELLLRAAGSVLQPLGVTEATLRDWLFSNAGYGAPPGFLRAAARPGISSAPTSTFKLEFLKSSPTAS
jgi:DNA polymerase-2